jgi:hypothetical protein
VFGKEVEIESLRILSVYHNGTHKRVFGKEVEMESFT